MPRIVDATLEAALASGVYKPFFRLGVGQLDTVSYFYNTITKYTLSPFGEIEITVLASENPTIPETAAVTYMRLRRGVVVNGVQYYQETADNYFIYDIKYDGYFVTFKGNFFPIKAVTLSANQTYQATIEQFGSLSDRGDLLFKFPTKTFWGNQFFPTGKTVPIRNHEHFRTMLKQKFFMGMTDGYGSDAASDNFVTVFCAFQFTVGEIEYEIETPKVMKIKQKGFQSYDSIINLSWKNDARTEYIGSATNSQPYNLGYIKDGDVVPGSLLPYTYTTSGTSTFTRNYPELIEQLEIPVNLSYLTGDLVTIRSTTTGLETSGFLLVTEYLDTNKELTWGLKIALWDYISNSEGGPI